MKRTKTNKPAILACDPSLTAWGWAVLENHVIIQTGVIRTSPQAKKRKIRETDDLTRRTRELLQELDRIVSTFNVTYIVAEAPHYSQTARGAIMIGIVYGVLEGFNVLRNIPLEWYLESDAKKALTGRNSASKAEIIKRVEEELDITLHGPKYKREAIADALAIYNVAELESQTLKFINR